MPFPDVFHQIFTLRLLIAGHLRVLDRQVITDTCLMATANRPSS
jgi:hypothetical protein